MKDFLGACLLGAILGAMFAYGIPAHAQTYVAQDQNGNVVNYYQRNQNTITVLDPKGNPVGQPYTAYSNQIVTPTGAAFGSTGYTVPMTPPSPPSVRVLQ